VVVLAIVGSVFSLGVGLVMPTVFSPSQLALLHGPLAVLLLFNIL